MGEEPTNWLDEFLENHPSLGILVVFLLCCLGWFSLIALVAAGLAWVDWLANALS